jgi:hypothetical protein
VKTPQVLIALLALSSPVLAQSRPDTRKMSCESARGLVQTRRAVVMSTGDDIYDRFVSTAGSCNLGENAVPAYARTLDYTGCHIGYTCEVPKGGRR